MADMRGTPQSHRQDLYEIRGRRGNESISSPYGREEAGGRIGWGEDMDPDMEGPDCCEGWPGVVRFGFPLKFPCLARKMKCGLLQCSYTLEKLLLAQGFRLCCGAAIPVEGVA